MNETIIQTCTEIGTGLPMIDTIIAMFRTQILPIIIVFVVVPFIFLMIYRINIGNSRKLTKSQMKDKLLAMVLLMLIFQIILYLVFMATDFTFITNIFGSLK